MILVYADGGGLGHLTRVRALRRTLNLDEPVCVLTSSDHRVDPRVAGGLTVIPVPFGRDDGDGRRPWLARTIAELGPSSIIVDAFPAGIAGEIDEATAGGIPCDHVARLLRWPAYRPLVPGRPAAFRTTYVIEPLGDDHRRHLDGCSSRLLDLELVDPDPDPEADPSAAGTWPPEVDRGRGPRWLIAHAGPADEVIELVAHARDQAEAEGVAPLLVVATSRDAVPPAAPDLVCIDRYPVWPLFATADRIVTAAGFNSMRQLVAHRARHRFVPMPRRFDDQFERARRARIP